MCWCWVFCPMKLHESSTLGSIQSDHSPMNSSLSCLLTLFIRVIFPYDKSKLVQNTLPLSRKRTIIYTKTLTELCSLVCWWRLWWWNSVVSFKAISVVILKKVNWNIRLNRNSKSKKRHNSYKNLDRVMYSCLLIEVMMVKKCCKFQSNICSGFEKKKKSKKCNDSYKNLDRLM